LFFSGRECRRSLRPHGRVRAHPRAHAKPFVGSCARFF
jgi:hypothetical protein